MPRGLGARAWGRGLGAAHVVRGGIRSQLMKRRILLNNTSGGEGKECGVRVKERGRGSEFDVGFKLFSTAVRFDLG